MNIKKDFGESCPAAAPRETAWALASGLEALPEPPEVDQ